MCPNCMGTESKSVFTHFFTFRGPIKIHNKNSCTYIVSVSPSTIYPFFFFVTKQLFTLIMHLSAEELPLSLLGLNSAHFTEKVSSKTIFLYIWQRSLSTTTQVQRLSLASFYITTLSFTKLTQIYLSLTYKSTLPTIFTHCNVIENPVLSD